MVAHKTRVIRTVGCIVGGVLSIFTSGIATAQVDCSPLDPRESISKEQEGKVNGAVDTLFKVAKAQGTVEGKLKEQIQNLQQGATASDQLLIRLRMLYLFCGMVANAKDLSTERKIQLFQEVNKEARPETSSESKPTAESKNEPVVLPLDLCKQLGGYAIYLEANNYHGIIGPAGIPLQQTGDGSFRFATNIVFSKETNRQFSAEINDPITGTCKGKTISFTRKLVDGSAHRHSGTISESPAGAITIEGSFLDENDKEYRWSGRVDNPIP